MGQLPKNYNKLYLKVLREDKTLAEKMTEIDDIIAFSQKPDGELRPDTTKYEKKRSFWSWFSGLLIV